MRFQIITNLDDSNFPISESLICQIWFCAFYHTNAIVHLSVFFTHMFHFFLFAICFIFIHVFTIY